MCTSPYPAPYIARMIALGLCILVQSLMFSLFRLFPSFNVRLEDAIVINYLVAASMAIGMAGAGHTLSRLDQPSTLAGVGMGLFFLYLFRKIGECTQQMGLGVVAIATKMSMVVPMLIFILMDPSDAFSWQKGAAILLAFPAVWYASTPSGSPDDEGTSGTGSVKGKVAAASWVLPAIVFLGSGMIDLGFGWFSTPEHMSCDEDRLSFASIPFMMAALIGTSRWALLPACKPRLDRPTVLGGVILGIINVGSLFFLLSAYEQMPLSRSAIVPMNNLGVVLATALAGMAFFAERPSRRNLLGWFLATTALVLLLQSE